MTTPSLTWSPHLYFPWSGGVSQQIDPDVNWFNHWITPGAGNPDVEEKAFTEVASYGKQLGLIIEVLLAIVDGAEQSATLPADAIAELRRIRERIALLKKVDATLAQDKIIDLVRSVRGRGEAELATLARELIPLLAPPQ